MIYDINGGFGIQGGSKHKGRQGGRALIFFGGLGGLSATPHHPLNPVFHVLDLPIQQESERAAAELEIRQQLRLVDGQNLIDGLVLDNDAVRDAEVDAEAGLDVDTVVADREVELALRLESALPEFIDHALLVGGFQQTGPERGMNFDSGIDDMGGGFLDFLVHCG